MAPAVAGPSPLRTVRRKRSVSSQAKGLQNNTKKTKKIPAIEPTRHNTRNVNKSSAGLNNNTRKTSPGSQAAGDSSENGGNEEQPDSSDTQDEDEQPAVTAPSCDKGAKVGRKAGHPLKPKVNGKALKKKSKAKDHNDSISDAGEGKRSLVAVATFEDELEDIQDINIDTDDDDYGAVDDISESDDADDELERLEEQMIISSFVEMDEDYDYPITSSASSTRNNDFGVGDQLFLANESFFDHASDVPGDDDTLMPSNIDSEIPETPRRVRFADESGAPSSTESTTSETESHQFSDTFLQQDRLEPSLLHRIVDDNSDDNVSLSEHEWDVGHDDGLLEYEHYGLEDSDSFDSETDEGETTDEDLPFPKTVIQPGSILREESSNPSSTRSSSHTGGSRKGADDFPRRHSLNGPVTSRTTSRGLVRSTGPKLGSFKADPSKATAWIGPSGRLMLIHPAKKSFPEGHQRRDLSTSSQQELYELLNDSDVASTPTSPMLSTDVNLMMSGLFHGQPGNEFLRGSSITGPPEAFFPFRSFDSKGTMDAADDDSEGDTRMVDVSDFLDFGDEATEDGTGANESNLSKALVGTKKPLDHLTGNNVNAFRRNISRVNAMVRTPRRGEFVPSSPVELSSAVRLGRRSELSSPLAPLRKRKRDSSHNGFESNRGNTVQRKLVDAHTHKRSKSAYN